MNSDEFGVVKLPRPTPICSVKDFAIPSFAALGLRVLSINCPSAGTPVKAEATRKPISASSFTVLSLRIESLLRFNLRYARLNL